MLAIVKAAKSVRASLKYNEQKVEQHQARLLDAHNFWQDKSELTMRDKLQRFNDLTVLNERSKKHSVHITLNFSPKDDLTDQQMTTIATGFMERIGFAEQPWLTYRHVDAAHPHMHIVTTNIQPDGSRIKNDLRSPSHLKQLCFALEERHHLTPAVEMPDLFKEEEPAAAKKWSYDEGESRITYGEGPTKTEIARVLDHVANKYAYTDYESYNAILSEFRVRADRGRENSPMYNNKGLYYHVIDGNGKKIGAPIKASAFRLPVALPHLEEKFRLNQEKVQEEAQYMRTRIDNCIHFATEPCSLAILNKSLMKENVRIVVDPPRKMSGLPSAPQPQPYDGHGFFYIDLYSKIVVRDTQLGEQYTASAILQRTGIEQDIRQLANKNRFRLTVGEQRILSQPGHQDPAETLNLLLKLSGRHDEIVDLRLELMEQRQLSQHQGHGPGRSR